LLRNAGEGFSVLHNKTGPVFVDKHNKI